MLMNSIVLLRGWQFKSNRTFTKWFNSIPLIGVGAIGVNKYFADENKQKE